MAIVKCTQLHGLADKKDYTCELSIISISLGTIKRLTKTKRRYCRPCHVDQVSISHHLIVTRSNPFFSPSIEADVVVIASCIPTLQPLLEIILGKRVSPSYSQGKSDQFKGSSNFPSSYNRSRQQSKTHDELGFTNIDRESQESILPADSNRTNSHALGHIHRKDDVTVEYEPAAPKSGPGRTSW
jgi:hypothetical protein